MWCLFCTNSTIIMVTFVIQIYIDKSGDVKFNDDTHLPGTSRLIYANLSEFQKLILSNGMTLHDFWIWGTHFPFSVVQ